MINAHDADENVKSQLLALLLVHVSHAITKTGSFLKQLGSSVPLAQFVIGTSIKIVLRVIYKVCV